MSKKQHITDKTQLLQRKRFIAERLCLGYTYGDIAKAAGLSSNYVASIAHEIRDDWDAGNITEMAYRMGQAGAYLPEDLSHV